MGQGLEGEIKMRQMDFPLSREARAVLLQEAGAPVPLLDGILEHNERAVLRKPEEWAQPPAFLPGLWWKTMAEQTPDGPRLVENLVHAFPILNFPLGKRPLPDDPLFLAVVWQGRNQAPPGKFSGRAPHTWRLTLGKTAFGEFPVLSIGNRTDFEHFILTVGFELARKSLPANLGALYMTGKPRWERCRAWLETYGNSPFAPKIPPRQAVGESFIVVSGGPYANIALDNLPAIARQVWNSASTRIRFAHELTHASLRQIRGKLSKSLAEELIADYEGLLASGIPEACHSDILAAVLGYGSGSLVSGRWMNYLPISLHDAAPFFGKLLEKAGKNLCLSDVGKIPPAKRLAILSHFTLEELASEQMEAGLHRVWRKMEPRFHSADL